MRATGYVVPAGHRLRLAVAPGYWPMLWPLPPIATINTYVDGCELALPLAPTVPPDLVVEPQADAPPHARAGKGIGLGLDDQVGRHCPRKWQRGLTPVDVRVDRRDRRQGPQHRPIARSDREPQSMAGGTT